MKNKTKAYSAGLYIVLALCMVAVMSVGIASLLYDYEDYDISIPEYSFPERPVGNESNNSAVDVGKNPSGVTPDISEPPAEPEKVFCNPVVNGEIQKKYSVDALIYSSTMGDYRTHNGIDITGKIGDSVLAFADGVIEEIKNDPMMGTTVVISHEDGLKSFYMNLQKTIPEGIEKGAQVKAGDVIGAIGDTAIIEIGEEGHLHFELTLNDKLIDPQNELVSE